MAGCSYIMKQLRTVSIDHNTEDVPCAESGGAELWLCGRQQTGTLVAALRYALSELSPFRHLLN